MREYGIIQWTGLRTAKGGNKKRIGGTNRKQFVRYTW